MAGPTSQVVKDFISSTQDTLNLQEDRYTGSLEEYLRSLWVVINKYKEQPVSYPLFATIITEAFETEPVEFDSQWLTYEKEIYWDYIKGRYIVYHFENYERKIDKDNVDAFAILEHTILFQIADLYRMRGDQLEDPYRYYGIDSPTGNRWYNFDVFTYWECATRGMEDHLRSITALSHIFSVCTWATFAKLLDLGKTYE